jgi:hypothetical protein
MKKTLFLLLIIVMLLSGCTEGSPESSPPATDPVPSTQQEVNQPPVSTNPPEETAPEVTKEVPTEETPEVQETLGPDCYGDETHPIGQSIADSYPELTDYDEVMVWFCNGFEFEDILTALQTSEDISIPAGELLEAFANGQTWEEIWVELGLVEP